jgi:CheY-like chemotaxis protein
VLSVEDHTGESVKNASSGFLERTGRKEMITVSGVQTLVVEDESVLRELIGRNLQKRGHDVSLAKDAREALALLRSMSFDLIFLDINLPDETGWEVLRIA